MLTGQNGVINRAVEAKEEVALSAEKEKIQLSFLSNSMQNNDYSIGEKLCDKNNGNEWKIIYTKNDKKAYGTNWIYIPKGTNIENYGYSLNSWLVNEKTGEMVRLIEEEYQKYQYGDNLAVTDGIILNIDPVNMSDNNSWGDGVTLKGVQDGDGYGFNGNEIKLDGVDDYVEVYVGDSNITNGITFEFYGRLKGTKSCLLSKFIKKPAKDWEQFSNVFRTYLESNNEKTNFNLSMNGSIDSESPWKSTIRGPHWLDKSFDFDYDENDGYITFIANLDTNTVAVYWNGQYVDETKVNHNWMIGGKFTDASVPFAIGVQTGGNEYGESYSKLDIYACRLYNKVLTSEEIKNNYNKTTEYRKMLINQN